MKPKIIAAIITVSVIVGTAAGLLLYCDRQTETNGGYTDFQIDEARINSIRNMVSLCTLEIDEEMAFKDSINGKWVVARERVRGRIKYDLEKLRIEHQGDTMLVYLPEETIEIRENESPDSYEILDYWDGKQTLFPRPLTTREENILKRRWASRIENNIRQQGYLKKARYDAMTLLVPLFHTLRGKNGTDAPIILVEEENTHDSFPAINRH